MIRIFGESQTWLTSGAQNGRKMMRKKEHAWILNGKGSTCFLVVSQVFLAKTVSSTTKNHIFSFLFGIYIYFFFESLNISRYTATSFCIYFIKFYLFTFKYKCSLKTKNNRFWVMNPSWSLYRFRLRGCLRPSLECRKASPWWTAALIGTGFPTVPGFMGWRFGWLVGWLVGFASW